MTTTANNLLPIGIIHDWGETVEIRRADLIRLAEIGAKLERERDELLAALKDACIEDAGWHGRVKAVLEKFR